MTRPRLTLCVITLNEEDRIGDCLDSAPFVDEILVLDSGSTDRTREIAAERGARVLEQEFLGHSEQKDRAVSLAETDWVLCLDADERLTQEVAEEIQRVLEEPDLPAGFSMARRNIYLGRWIRRGGWYPDRKVRLFDRRRGKWGGVNPHDHVYLDGPERGLAGDMLHCTFRSIADHVRQVNSFTTIAAGELEERGRRPGMFKILFRPMWKFLRMYFLKLGFLDGRAGFVVAVLGSYYVFLKHAKHWELSRRPSES